MHSSIQFMQRLKKSFSRELFLLQDLIFQRVAETPCVGFRFRSAPAFRIFGPAPPYAEGSKT